MMNSKPMATFAEQLFELQCQINRIQSANYATSMAKKLFSEAEYQRWIAYNPVIDEIERVTK